MADITAET